MAAWAASPSRSTLHRSLAGSTASRCSATRSFSPGTSARSLAARRWARARSPAEQRLVDAGPHDRVDEDERAAAGLDEAGCAEQGGSALGFAVREAGERGDLVNLVPAPGPRARGQAGRQGPESRASLSAIDLPMAGAPIRSTSIADESVGSRPSARRATASSCRKNGVPRVTRTHASTKAGPGAAPSAVSTNSETPDTRERVKPDDLGGRVRGDRLEQRRTIRRLRAHVQRPRAPGAAPPGAAAEGEEPQRRHVCPVRVVHDEAHGLPGRQVGTEPVEAVQHRERPVAAFRGLTWISRRRAGQAENPSGDPRGAVQ